MVLFKSVKVKYRNEGLMIISQAGNTRKGSEKKEIRLSLLCNNNEKLNINDRL